MAESYNRGLSGPITIVSPTADSPRIEARDQDARNQTVRENMRNTVQNRLQRMLFWFFLTVILVQVITISVVLGLSWKQECEGGLRQFLIVYGGLLFINSIVLVYNRINPPLDYYNAFIQPSTQMARFMLSLSQAVDLSLFLTFFFGIISISLSKKCRSSSPMLFWTSVAIITLNVLQIALPLLILISAVCCLPCIIVILQRMYPQPNRGATQDIIDCVDKFKYTPNVEKQNYNGINIDPEDAKCSICLQPYTTDVYIRVLRCKHHFHRQCADDWFHISATCPLCVRSIAPNSPAADGNA